MTTPPTETQLLQALAKMLPEKLLFIQGALVWSALVWRNPNPRVANAEIQPISYLGLCRMVEEGLTEEETGKYLLILNKGSQSSGLAQWNLTHASYSQRIIALARVKNIAL